VVAVVVVVLLGLDDSERRPLARRADGCGATEEEGEHKNGRKARQKDVMAMMSRVNSVRVEELSRCGRSGVKEGSV
jgi:hypothetical protein